MALKECATKMQLLSELIHYKFFQNSWAGSKKHFHQGIGILYCTSKFAFAHTFCWQSPILIQGPTAKPTPIPDNQWFVYSHLFPIALLCHQYLRLLHLLWINENFHWNFIDHIFILIVQHIFCILGCTHIYKFVWIKYIQCSACSVVCPTKEIRKTISIFGAFWSKKFLWYLYITITCKTCSLTGYFARYCMFSGCFYSCKFVWKNLCNILSVLISPY